MKKYIIVIMLVLMIGLVSAARQPYYKVNNTKTNPTTPISAGPVSDQIVTDKGTVVKLQQTANPNITQRPGGETFDLSTPQTTTTPNITATVTNNTLTPIKVKHSFWYWLWPPHWFTK